jgi:hypothetical protein
MATAGPVTDFEHIVGVWENAMDRLRVKIPRPLCGTSLTTGIPSVEGREMEGRGPICPECARLEGLTHCARCGSYDLGWSWVGPRLDLQCNDCDGTDMWIGGRPA